jgi:cytoskeleton protein RodZ
MAPAPASEPTALSASVPEPEVAPVADAAAQPAPQASAAASAARVSVPKPAASKASDAASAASDAAAAVQTDQHGNGVVEQDAVTFNATDPVWVGVRDGSGKWVVNRTLAQGDTLTTGGELPLSVTVGDKNAVTVTVRGQAFDLNSYARRSGKVARFTVDPANGP